MPFIPARLCLLQSPTGVGKSSLICTLISRHFSENGMPDVYANVSIPENAVWDNQVQVTIIDSSQLISNEEMTQKILEADSIVLVYDVERRETLEHLMTYWLPQCIVPLTRAPVIVAGNKVDSRSDFFDRLRQHHGKRQLPIGRQTICIIGTSPFNRVNHTMICNQITKITANRFATVNNRLIWFWHLHYRLLNLCF